MRVPAAACLLLAGTLLPACAHVEAPPGGEADLAAPALVQTRPDTFARLRSYLGPVIFVFDEGLSEQGIDTVVTVSPRTSPVAVDKHGNEVRVELRRGWEAGRVYQVTLHPGVRDRFNNATKTPQRVVFSTGPEIVHTVASGRVVERTTLQPATGALVEAVHAGDSLVYQTRPDSTGTWRLEYLPEGDYLLRAYNDTNRDLKLQPYEAVDTTALRVTRGDTTRIRRLAVLAPDSTAPRAGGAVGGGQVIEVTFDDFLDPAQPLAPGQVTVTGPGGAVVAVRELRVGPFPAAGDSAAAAEARPAAGAVRDTAGTARRDSSSEPLPARILALRTAAPLTPDAQYTVRVSGVRNLVGLVGGGEVQLRTPRAAAAPAPARGDSAGAAPRPAAPPAPAPAPPPAPTNLPRPVALAPAGRAPGPFTLRVLP